MRGGDERQSGAPALLLAPLEASWGPSGWESRRWPEMCGIIGVSVADEAETLAPRDECPIIRRRLLLHAQIEISA